MQLQYFVDLSLVLWTFQVAGQISASANWTWTSSVSSTSSLICTGCNVAAEEYFLSYPYSVSTVTSSVTLTVVPYITVYGDGSSETNYVTATQGSDGATVITGSVGTETTELTWEPYAGVTLTYPTTYVNFPSPYGGLNYSSNGACVTATAPLTLPTNSEIGLIYPVSISNWDTNIPWNVTQQLLDYLDSIPAVSQQFNGTSVGKCAWETYVTPSTTSVLPVQKITAQFLTAVTDQNPITISSNRPSSTPTTTPSSLVSPTAFTRNLPTASSTTTPPVVVSTATSSASQSSTPLGIASAIISVLWGTSILFSESSVVPPVTTSLRTLVDPIATSTITHSPSTSVIVVSGSAISTMTLVPGYVTTVLVTLGGGAGGLNATSIGPAYTGPVYTGRADRVRHSFLGWILAPVLAMVV